MRLTLFDQPNTFREIFTARALLAGHQVTLVTDWPLGFTEALREHLEFFREKDHPAPDLDRNLTVLQGRPDDAVILNRSLRGQKAVILAPAMYGSSPDGGRPPAFAPQLENILFVMKKHRVRRVFGFYPQDISRSGQLAPALDRGRRKLRLLYSWHRTWHSRRQRDLVRQTQILRENKHNLPWTLWYFPRLVNFQLDKQVVFSGKQAPPLFAQLSLENLVYYLLRELEVEEHLSRPAYLWNKIRQYTD